MLSPGLILSPSLMLSPVLMLSPGLVLSPGLMLSPSPMLSPGRDAWRAGVRHSMVLPTSDQWVGARKNVTPLLTCWSYVFVALTHPGNDLLPVGTKPLPGAEQISLTPTTKFVFQRKAFESAAYKMSVILSGFGVLTIPCTCPLNSSTNSTSSSVSAGISRLRSITFRQLWLLWPSH